MDQAQQISQFSALTGSSEQTAKFYLEGAQWDIQTATDNYFEAGDDDGIEHHEASVAEPAPVRPGPPSQGHSHPSAANAAPAAKPKSRRPAQGAIRGFADLNQDSDSEDDDGNEYYTGGEKSGQVVKGNDNKGKDVESYFEQLRKKEHATETHLSDLNEEGPSRIFTGRARTLGDSGPSEDRAPAAAARSSGRPTQHTVTFYSDRVFTVDDGEPRSITDPANRSFLEALSSGRAPDELLSQDDMDGESEIQVALVRKAEEYKPPEKKMQAFSGTGRTLAGDTPSSSRAAPVTPVASASNSGTWEGVDESKPTTSIQLRLADGSRTVARFNHDHTIGDIRRFIQASAPAQSASYQLMTAFPPQQLTNLVQTISDAGLQNAVIIQKR